MTEEAHRRWDVTTKIVGFLCLSASALWGIYQYFDVRSRELTHFNDQKEREFYSEFWNQRLKLYLQTLDAAARVSKAEDDGEYKKAAKEFRTLFDGSMTVVEDASVDDAMHEFARLIDDVDAGRLKSKDLGTASYSLGRKCFESLRASWDKPFSQQE